MPDVQTTMVMVTVTPTPQATTDHLGMLAMEQMPLPVTPLSGLMQTGIPSATTPAGLLGMLVLESLELRIKTDMAAQIQMAMVGQIPTVVGQLATELMHLSTRLRSGLTKMVMVTATTPQASIQTHVQLISAHPINWGI